MYHSIYFGNVNTYDDWFLIPTSRPLFLPPKAKTNYVDIPGADGSLDLSESLTGYPVYENRTGTFEFYVENGHAEWYEIYSSIMDTLNGREMIAILEDDPYYYYTGRFAVDKWKSEKNWSKVTISYDVKPYKYSVYDSSDDEELAPIFTGLAVTSTAVTLDVSDYILRMPVCPTFEVEGSTGVTLIFNNPELGIEDYELTVTDGSTQDPNVVFTNLSGSNECTIKYSGSGTLSIIFRNGRL